MPTASRPVGPFVVKDSALIALATGLRAENLKEFRDGLVRVPLASIYYHFWGRLLRPGFDEPEYNNDFASWAYHGLHEKPLAERLSMIDPAGYEDLEALRQRVVEVVEELLDESGTVPWARADQQFYFVQSQTVVLDAGLVLSSPAELPAAVLGFSTGTIFYHVIDARRRTSDRVDDFTEWLREFGTTYARVVEGLKRLDPYFSSLVELRRIIAGICQACRTPEPARKVPR
ncbi:MAG: hypothetical protein HY900_27925 [Deltaproteobacteria bacterium]|nr:hypothetical protein [Deltaproteobacteria bacterium]